MTRSFEKLYTCVFTLPYTSTSPQIHTVCHSWVCDLLDSHPQDSLKDSSQVVSTVECANLADLGESGLSSTTPPDTPVGVTLPEGPCSV